MATDLRNKLNSEYVNISNRFRKIEVIQIYVEGFLDKIFWHYYLQSYENAYNCKFHISTLRDRDKILCGKASILSYKKEDDLGPNLWICIDSDYDEIIRNYSDFSALIKRNKYIITTWWYSIENIKCTPELLKEDVIKLSLPDDDDFDFNIIFSNISKLYKNLFFLLLEMKEKHDNRFKIEDFCKCLSYVSFDSSGNLADKIIRLKIKEWKNHNKNLFDQYGSKFHHWEAKLKSLGFSEDDYYKLYNGHALINKIAIPVVLVYANKFRAEQIAKITNGADKKDRKKSLVDEYNNKTLLGAENVKSRIEQLIIDNMPNDICQASIKIKEQIKKALSD